MNRQTAIRRAQDQLANDRDANSMLNRERFVRILPEQDAIATPQDASEKSPDYVVTFTIEQHAIMGLRLMAEFQGVKEFVA
jgi:hypothetical protein